MTLPCVNAPHVADVLQLCRTKPAHQQLVAVYWVIVEFVNVLHYILSAIHSQMVQRLKPRIEDSTPKPPLQRHDGPVLLQPFQACLGRAGQQEVVRIHVADVIVIAEKVAPRPPGTHIALVALNEMHRAGLVSQRGEALPKPRLLRAGVRQDVDVDHRTVAK